MEIDEALKTRYGTERPFTVPDAYFDRVEEEVMRSVAAEAAPPVVRVVRKSLWKQLSPLVAAACVVGVIVLVGLGVSSTNPQGDMAATVSHAPKVTKAEPYTDDLDARRLHDDGRGRRLRLYLRRITLRAYEPVQKTTPPHAPPALWPDSRLGAAPLRRPGL